MELSCKREKLDHAKILTAFTYVWSIIKIFLTVQSVRISQLELPFGSGKKKEDEHNSYIIFFLRFVLLTEVNVEQKNVPSEVFGGIKEDGEN